MKREETLAIIVFLFVTVSACYYDNKEELYQNFPQACDTSNTTFSATILPIMHQSCAIPNCHVGVMPQSSLDLSTYGDVQIIGLDGRLVGTVTGSSGLIMPPSGPLTQCEVKKIKKWVQNGVQNN